MTIKKIPTLSDRLDALLTLDPTNTQETNIFFIESTIRLMDNIFDIFKLLKETSAYSSTLTLKTIN